VAVEPCSGLPDAYNNGIGLVRLKPGRTFTCGYEVRLSRLP
jgi:aldose 1-epimerase